MTGGSRAPGDQQGGPRRVHRGSLLAAAVVGLAEALSADTFEPLELLHSLTRTAAALLDCSGATLLLADQRGELQLVSATTPTVESYELFALDAGAGPCQAAYRTGRAVLDPPRHDPSRRWPRLDDFGLALGVAAVAAVPVPVGPRVVGALGFHWSTAHHLDAADVLMARAVAGLVTAGLVHERTARRGEVLAARLQDALNVRITVDQSTGVVAEVLGLDVVAAFTLLSGYAARHRLPVGDVARRLAQRELDPHVLAGPPRRGAGPSAV